MESLAAANRGPTDTGTEESILYTTFRVSDVLCAIPTLSVQEVIRLERITRVPRAGGCVVGIINLRGRIVTILDLANRLGLGRTEPGDQTRALILEWNGENLGLLVDAVSDVEDIRQESISPPPANLAKSLNRFFRGVHKTEGRLLGILSIEEVLGEDDR
jgi:purine-binding chemotaxis protein CheW